MAVEEGGAAFTLGRFLRATERQLAHPFADSQAQTGIFPNRRRVISSGKQRPDPGGRVREFFFFLHECVRDFPTGDEGREGGRGWNY